MQVRNNARQSSQLSNASLVARLAHEDKGAARLVLEDEEQLLIKVRHVEVGG